MATLVTIIAVTLALAIVFAVGGHLLFGERPKTQAYFGDEFHLGEEP